MNIKMKFVAENGAELRKQMLEFLGIDDSSTVRSTFVPLSDFAKQAVNDSPKLEVMTGAELAEKAAPSTTRTRRSKAEIEAEKKAAETVGETKAPEANEEPAPSTEESEDAANADATASETESNDTPSGNDPEIDRPFLTEVVLAKGREGKKPLMLEIFKQFKQADGTTAVGGLPTLDPKDYAAFYELVKDL